MKGHTIKRGKSMDLFNVKEAAELTRMSQSWWRQRVFRNEVRFLKIGSRVLIPKSTVDDLLEGSIVEARTTPVAKTEFRRRNKEDKK
jgi:excisionase family DNA binding protein